MPIPRADGEWWEKVGNHLDKIGAGAAMCERHCKQLAARPDFETAAWVDLDTCAMALKHALARIERAQATYQAKRIDE